MRSGPLEGSYDIISPETATQSERVEKQTTVARRCDAIYLKLPRNKSYSIKKVRFGDGNPQIQDHLAITVSLPKNHPENLTFGASTRFSGSRRVIVTRSRVHSGARGTSAVAGLCPCSKWQHMVLVGYLHHLGISLNNALRLP